MNNRKISTAPHPKPDPEISGSIVVTFEGVAVAEAFPERAKHGGTPSATQLVNEEGLMQILLGVLDAAPMRGLTLGAQLVVRSEKPNPHYQGDEVLFGDPPPQTVVRVTTYRGEKKQ